MTFRDLWFVVSFGFDCTNLIIKIIKSIKVKSKELWRDGWRDERENKRVELKGTIKNSGRVLWQHSYFTFNDSKLKLFFRVVCWALKLLFIERSTI